MLPMLPFALGTATPVATKCIALLGAPIVIVGAEVYPEPPLTIVIPESELLVIVAPRTASSPEGDAVTEIVGAST